MKASGNKLKYLTLFIALGMCIGASAQEYDDLYFTKKDRKKVSYDLKPAADDSKATYEAFTNNSYSENYSAKNVNPEYIARYRSQSQFSNPEQSIQSENQDDYLDQNQGYYPEDAGVEN
jgi:hypothetical protein